VLLLSPEAVESKWVRAEVSFAFTQDKRIVPVLLKETNLTDFFFLTNVDCIDFRHWGTNRSVDDALRKLARSLELADTPDQSTPPPPAIPAFNLAELNRRMKELEAISEELRSLEASSLYKYRVENNYYPVPSEGNPFATIMMIGEPRVKMKLNLAGRLSEHPGRAKLLLICVIYSKTSYGMPI